MNGAPYTSAGLVELEVLSEWLRDSAEGLPQPHRAIYLDLADEVDSWRGEGSEEVTGE